MIVRTQDPSPWDWLLVLGAIAALVLMLASCSSTVRYVCPPLAPPPGPVVSALEQTGRKDPSSAAWTIGLEKHYEKLDACQP